MHPIPADAASLLERARQRDPAAAEALVEWLYPVVLIVIRRRLPRGADEQDLAQEIFLRLFDRLDQFRGEASALEAWARRIAFTTCLNQLRHQRCRPELRWSDLPPDQAELLASVVVAGDEADPARQAAARDLVQRLLEQLDPKDRWLIELVDLEQRDLAEVKSLTGWSAVNVRVRLFRARRRLREALEELLHEPESA